MKDSRNDLWWYRGRNPQEEPAASGFVAWSLISWVMDIKRTEISGKSFWCSVPVHAPTKENAHILPLMHIKVRSSCPFEPSHKQQDTIRTRVSLQGTEPKQWTLFPRSRFPFRQAEVGMETTLGASSHSLRLDDGNVSLFNFLINWELGQVHTFILKAASHKESQNNCSLYWRALVTKAP